MNGRNIMLLGIAIILFGIACSSTTVGGYGLVTMFAARYAHWLGLLVVILGLFVRDTE